MSTAESTDIMESSSTHPTYEDYKDSGGEWLREIPSEWSTTTVKWLSEIGYGLSQPPSEKEGGIPFVRATNISEGSISAEGIVRVDPNDIPNEEDVILHEGDLLVVRSGAYTGDSAFVDKEFEGGVAGYDMIVRTTDEVIPKYLSYFFLSSPFRRQVRITSGRTAQAHLNAEELGRFEVTVPKLEEQRIIAAYLDRETERIDALIEKKERLIDLLEEKRTALISRVVTKGLDADVEMQDSGVEWLGEIPAGWDVARLKFLSEVQSGIAKGKRYDDNVDTVELPYLRVANVQDGFLNLDEVSQIEVAVDEVGRYLLQSGDVLMTEGGDYDKLGRGTVWNGDIEPCLHQNHIFAVRPRSVESEWVALVTQARYAKHFFIVQSVQSTNLASISMSSLQDLPVVVPPRETRQAILDHVDRETERIDTLIRKVEVAIDRLKEYRTALISAAVTGQIDVRGERKTNAVKEVDTWARMNLVMELIRRMRTARHQSFGRTMLVKMLYLIQHHVRVKGLRFNYKRKDFGPYPSELRYEVENSLQDQGWLNVSERGDQVQYELREKADDETVQGYFESSWGDVKDQIDEIVSFFHRFENADQAEIVATLYAAWNDLLILDRPHDEDDIIDEVLHNWHPRKQTIDEDRWRNALRWMKDEGLVPSGFGEPTEGEE
jgi:type I restriction enzyme S subunit